MGEKYLRGYVRRGRGMTLNESDRVVITGQNPSTFADDGAPPPALVRELRMSERFARATRLARERRDKLIADKERERQGRG